MATPGDNYAVSTAATGAPGAASIPDYVSPMNVGGMISQTMESGGDDAFAETKRAASTWEERYEQLKQFRQDNGHCLVPGRYKENPPLGRWVESQVRTYSVNLSSRRSIFRPDTSTCFHNSL